MDTIVIIAIVITVLFFIGVGVFFPSTRRRAKKGDQVWRDYAHALELIIGGEYDRALGALRTIVERTSEFVDAYIKIGDLFRLTGRVEHAIRVHQEQEAREGLTPEQVERLHRSLVRDFFTSEKPERGLAYVEALLQRDKNDTWALEWKTRLCEQMRDWDGAFDAYQRLLKAKNADDAATLAFYRVQSGKRLVEEGKGRDGRLKFREAIKLDPTTVAAYLELSSSYRAERRYRDALAVLRRLMAAAPQHASVAFDLIEDVLYEAGGFGDIENVYTSLIQRAPEEAEPYLGLASLKAKMGDHIAAVDLCRQALSKDPDNVAARVQLARFLHAAGRHQEAAAQALQVLEHLQQQHAPYVCRYCGWSSRVPSPRCLQCLRPLGSGSAGSKAKQES
ncbi:MAG: tetratricopeptide repeat protein [candidate division KSB1 bacterium]|nr:tetratricopeptide repeat protein [candidate division KSB1 bacterium]MDZ7385332.1 tetratricopeptide repeat protein [candidate division KSB1 bacterium]MDZ7392746.1 tetratricopeptide repeat protein [candidate division KSB1 bacterium]MDZ7414289.1 tetratricopeptide repeat protein [candidate division KSB1 bacterium]